jgi:hypothetical protein
LIVYQRSQAMEYIPVDEQKLSFYYSTIGSCRQGCLEITMIPITKNARAMEPFGINLALCRAYF